MSISIKSRDAQIAWQLHKEINRHDVTGITENAAFPNDDLKENYKPKTLVDKTLEIIDPTPNIHTLFIQFDKRFFWNKLLPVEVKWSHRMTSCAGTCSFNTGSRYCVIALSSPLLKLRPRKDLIETLLHEMIHAYLFITNNNRDRDGHGPEFRKHMQRINKEAGTNITIYHSFHAEVRLYQQHWWRCNGVCQGKKPYFGMVRRSVNRAPGPNDFWYKEHQLTCGGQFIKVREPEKPEKLKKSQNEPKKDLSKPGLDKWLIPSPKNKPKDKSLNDLTKPKAKPGSSTLNNPKNKPGSNTNKTNKPCSSNNNPFKPSGSSLKTKGGSKVITVNKWNTNSTNEPGIRKLGNTTNNVHGFGTGGPGSSTSKSSTSSGIRISSSGILGGSSTGQSRLLKIFSPTSKKSQSQLDSKKNQSTDPIVKCPICKDSISEQIANEHIDTCLIQGKETPFVNSTPKFMPTQNDKGRVLDGKDLVECPVCCKSIVTESIIDHINLCLTLQDKKESSPVPKKFNSPSTSIISPITSPSMILINESPQSTIVIDDSDTETETPIKKRKMNGLVDFIFKLPGVAQTDDKTANCPVCVNKVNVNDMNRHLDDCLAGVCEDFYTPETGPSRETDTNEKDEKGKEKREKCLICNEVLDPSVSLVQHLDECLKNMFDDENDSFETGPIADKNSNSKESKSAMSVFLPGDHSKDESQNESDFIDLTDSDKNELSLEIYNRFPCPVCTSLIPQKDMIQHLDTCLE